MGILTTIKREVNYVGGLLRMLKSVKDVNPENSFLLADELELRVDSFGSNTAFIEDDRKWSYDDFEDYANKVSGWAQGQEVKAGETVAVFVRNRLEYVALWFGLSKIGAIPALLNFQLSGSALAHCVNISDAKHVILDHEMADQWEAAKDDVTSDVTVWIAYGEGPDYENFDEALSEIVPNRPSKDLRKGIKAGDQAMKMFTSGTTGLPKAAKVTHVRAQNYLRGIGSGIKSTASDRMMMVLPLYHATGGLVGIGSVLTHGGAVIVQPKFSATRFWDEVIKHGATQFTYVGELCRFLLSTPAHPKEREHKIKWILGNGLREEVWTGFVNRFNIDNVAEFYGATEGNVSLINLGGPPGAVGRVPDYLKFKFNMDIIRFDVDTEENPRGADGFCIPADIGEVGEVVGEIRPDDARFRFDGYQNKDATKKKILRNVFKKDDMWFRTGDLMRRDKLGYYYFMDRVGDTYRWKAENVATGEVAAVLSKHPGITQANVYGVEVPGYDGRAGMAALVCEGDLDLKALAELIEAELPVYARPVFLRLSKESDTTSTFKFKKTNLVKAGFDPANISEPLYYSEGKSAGYKVLNKKVFKAIKDGSIRI